MTLAPPYLSTMWAAKVWQQQRTIEPNGKTKEDLIEGSVHNNGSVAKARLYLELWNLPTKPTNPTLHTCSTSSSLILVLTWSPKVSPYHTVQTYKLEEAGKRKIFSIIADSTRVTMTVSRSMMVIPIYRFSRTEQVWIIWKARSWNWRSNWIKTNKWYKLKNRKLLWAPIQTTMWNQTSGSRITTICSPVSPSPRMSQQCTQLYLVWSLTIHSVPSP